jgi:hypothetical protein
MKIDAASSRTVVIVATLLLVGASLAVTQPFETGVTRVTVCVKSNGQMRMPASNATACGPTEQPVRWVVDGEVTDVRVGEGLVATREGGSINLELDPSILECEKCNDGKVFAGFNDGPGAIPGQAPDFAPGRIAQLFLPEGDYAVFAKMRVDLGEAGKAVVSCKLQAGTDSDEASVVLENPPEFNVLFDVWSRDIMKLQLVHRFEAPGRVVLSCADRFAVLTEFADPYTLFTHLKIIAMKASNLSNVVLSN